MTVLLENRSISMILMVPDVDAPTSNHNVERIDPNPSMPVYHGTIIHVEPHSKDRNTSDLIIRIPNFQRSSLSTNDTDTKKQTSIKRRAPICPVVANSNPIEQINRENIHNVNLKQHQNVHNNRLTTGLRSLSRAFTHNCRSKRTASVTEITFPRALPDVEVMTEKCQLSTSTKKHIKGNTFSTPIPKMTPPKIFSIKRKDLQMKKRQISSSSSSSISSTDIQEDIKHKRPDQISTSTAITTQYTEVSKSNSPKVTSFLQGLNEQDNSTQPRHLSEVDEHHEMEANSLTYEVEQQIKAICQLVSDQPISSIDADSLSTHRYSSISGIIHEHHTEETSSPEESSAAVLPTTIEIPENIDKKSSSKPYRPFHIQTSILQPDISVVRIGTSNLTTEIGRILPGEIGFDNRQKIEKIVEEDHSNTIDSNDEILAECYEVTYQLDENNQIINQSTIPIPITLDPSEYRQLISGLETPPNQYEQIEQTNTIPEDRTSDPIPSKYSISDSSSDHSSRHCTLQHSDIYDGYGVYISSDIETHREHFIQQVEELSPGDQAGLQDNDRILCINGTPVIDEDYTVVLQLIKHGLDTDTLDFDVMSNDAYEEFKSQMNSMS